MTPPLIENIIQDLNGEVIIIVLKYLITTDLFETPLSSRKVGIVKVNDSYLPYLCSLIVSTIFCKAMRLPTECAVRDCNCVMPILMQDSAATFLW